VECHQFGNVVTEDLRKVIEELSGRSYDQFFDQWLYHAHHPELEANYSWDEKTKLAKVSLRQTQRINQNVLLFNFPLTIRFKGKYGTVDRSVVVSGKESVFYFPLDSAPQLVRLDPDYTLLAKTTFNLPNDMLYAQFADREDVIGRLLAIEQLKEKKDHETVAKLKEALNNDPFYGVRREAASALQSLHTDDALEALLASTKQPDARVRLRVTSAINGFYRETADAFASNSLASEKNPIILSSSIGALGKYARPEVQDLLIKYLNSQSYRNRLADAAIEAMRAQDDPVYLAPLQETLRTREPDFRSRGFASGLDALAYLARNEHKKEAVRDFLSGYVNAKKESIQIAAIRALATLGDSGAISVLQTFANTAKDSPQQKAAEKAVADLRAARKPVDDFKNLRQEVLDLEKTSREQSKELEDLKKQFAAKEVAAPKSQSKSRSRKKDGK
jgi:aminopeptidase N